MILGFWGVHHPNGSTGYLSLIKKCAKVFDEKLKSGVKVDSE
jgi:hypothetical protein